MSRYRTVYQLDPRWITARFGRCVKCGADLKGKPAFYFPLGRHAYCEHHGRAESADFEAAAFDEAMIGGVA